MPLNSLLALGSTIIKIENGQRKISKTEKSLVEPAC